MVLIPVNNYIDKDVTNGYTQFFSTIISHLDLTKDLQIKIKIRRTNLTTDNNLLYNIFPNVDTETFIYTYDFQSIKKIFGNPKVFTLYFKIELDSYINIVERKYLKLDALLANVGSIVVIFDLITKFFAYFFSEGNMEQSIYREIFYIKRKKNDSYVDANILIRNFTQKFNKTGFLLINKNINRMSSNLYKNQALSMPKDPKQKEFELKIFQNNKQKEIINENEKENEQIKINEGSQFEIDSIIDKTSRFTNEVKSFNKEKIKTNQGRSQFEIDSNIDKTSRFLNEDKSLKNHQNQAHDELKEINDFIKDIEVKKIEDEKLYENFKKILKEKTIKKSIGVNFYKFFRLLGIKKNKNIESLIKLQDFIRQELDIVKFIKKLIEYENFKSLIMTEHQIKVINLMQKRNITEEILDEDSLNFYNQYYFKNKMKELKAYKFLVDNLNNFNDENKYSKKIIDKIKKNYID